MNYWFKGVVTQDAQTAISLTKVAIASLLTVALELARRPAATQTVHCPVQPTICDSSCPKLDLHPVVQQRGEVEEIVDNKVTGKVSIALAFKAVYELGVTCC